MFTFALGETKTLKVAFKDAAENVTPLTGPIVWSEEHGMFETQGIQVAAIPGEPDKVQVTATAVGSGRVKAVMSLPVSGTVSAEENYVVNPGLPTHGVITIV